MTCDELQQLTALRALGILDGAEADALHARLQGDAAARVELARFLDAAAALGTSLPVQRPPRSVRARVLEEIARTSQKSISEPASPPPAAIPGMQFIPPDAPWLPSPIPGGRLKILSGSPAQDYAMLLIELSPGTIYPEHDHFGAEEMYILTGDLLTEGRLLGPGDFLHADPGTHHHDLRTPNGCTAIMVVPRATLEAAMAGIQ